jgi:hypothetical protein
MFCISQIRFDFDGLGIDDLGRNFNTLPKLGYMEDVMNSCQLRRKLKVVSYRSTDFKDFKGFDVSRSKFPFYVEPLNTSSRRYSKIHEVSDLKLKGLLRMSA